MRGRELGCHFVGFGFEGFRQLYFGFDECGWMDGWFDEMGLMGRGSGEARAGEAEAETEAESNGARDAI